MSHIHKYAVTDLASGGTAGLGHGVIVHVGPDAEGRACAWARHNADDPAEPIRRTFEVVGTGHEWPELAEHRGTWVADPFVWHLIETTWAP